MVRAARSPRCDLPRLNWPPAANCSVRSDRSWPTVSPATCDQPSASATRSARRPIDDDQLHFPVDGAVGQLDLGEGAGDAGRELGERGRHGGHVHARLGGVRPVVEPDGEHLPRRRHRRSQVALVERPRSRTVVRSRLATNARKASHSS